MLLPGLDSNTKIQKIHREKLPLIYIFQQISMDYYLKFEIDNNYCNEFLYYL